MKLQIRSDAVQWDALALGEIMLRLDPGPGRIRTARSFDVWEGGGEYNVVRGLRKCFGLRAAVASALVDNEIGRLIEDLILQGGVDPRYVQWLPFDGIGRAARNGLNFTERGFGARPALGVSDRGHSAAGQLGPGSIPWKKIFAEDGARWFHSGGIFAALSPTTGALLVEGVRAAKASRTAVSFDFNFRPSLWKALPPSLSVRTLFSQIIESVDVVFGHEADLTRVFEYAAPVSAKSSAERFAAAGEWLLRRFPNVSLLAVSAKDGAAHELAGMAFSAEGLAVCDPIRGAETFDRVGSGDSFAAGLLFGLLAGRPLQESLRLGAAHAALAITTPGDNSMACAAEVEQLARDGTLCVTR